MIRSLVIALNPKSSIAGLNNGANNEGLIAAAPRIDANNSVDEKSRLRRNLTRESLEKCFAEGDNMWIDIIAPEDEEIHWLERLLQLSPTVVADLLREDRRPILLVYPRYLFLSLFQPYLQSHIIVGKEIHCIIGKNFYVTIHQADTSTLEEAYNRVVQNPDSWHRGVAYFLYLTGQHTIDTYYPLLDRISNQLNDLEEKFLNDSDDKQAQKSLYRIKRHLIKLRQMIAPQREVLSNLIGEQMISNTNDTQDLFQHLYGRLLGIYDLIDSQRDLASNVLEIISNQHARKTGEAVNRLTIISLVFLPFTFFVGFFDSNFFTIGESIVLPVNGLVLAVVIIVLMIVSIGLMRTLFQRRGWF